jgi:hypothetical protein
MILVQAALTTWCPKNKIPKIASLRTGWIKQFSFHPFLLLLIVHKQAVLCNITFTQSSETMITLNKFWQVKLVCIFEKRHILPITNYKTPNYCSLILVKDKRCADDLQNKESPYNFKYRVIAMLHNQ